MKTSVFITFMFIDPTFNKQKEYTYHLFESNKHINTDKARD